MSYLNLMTGFKYFIYEFKKIDIFLHKIEKTDKTQIVSENKQTLYQIYRHE